MVSFGRRFDPTQLAFVLFVLVIKTSVASLVCINGGTRIVDVNSGERCVCTSGYTGTICDVALACSSNPCQRGICRNNGTSFHCQCPAGYSGISCETFDGYCTSSPCTSLDKASTCTESNQGYTCSCSNDDDFYGLNCEARTPESRPQGCSGEEPESYCLCNVNGNTVKVPLPAPKEDIDVGPRDIIAGVIGASTGWLIGTIFLALYHVLYSPVGESLLDPKQKRVDVARPPTASSMNSLNSDLSHFITEDTATHSSKDPQLPPLNGHGKMPLPPQTPHLPAPEELTMPDHTTSVLGMNKGVEQVYIP